MSPSFSFRIYPGSKHGKYYVVQVFRSLRVMREFCRKNCVYQGGVSHMLGICHRFKKISYRKSGRGIVSKHCGNIHFTERAGVEVVSHEMTHAAFYFVTDVKHAFDADGVDEPLALAQGWLMKQATAALYDAGIWK